MTRESSRFLCLLTLSLTLIFCALFLLSANVSYWVLCALCEIFEQGREGRVIRAVHVSRSSGKEAELLALFTFWFLCLLPLCGFLHRRPSEFWDRRIDEKKNEEI